MRDYMPGQDLCDALNRERDIADLEPRLSQLALDWANGKLAIQEALRAAAVLGWQR